MKNKRKNILLIAGMLLALLVGILAYSAYTQKQIYQESTANLLSTYGQSAKTFTMFAQRNWNILNDWDSYLGTLAELGEQEGQWQEYIAQKATWQYTDFYLFNEQCEFWTTAGRQGTAEYMKATFEKLYTENKPVISSYISSQGIRKILFAIQWSSRCSWTALPIRRWWSATTTPCWKSCWAAWSMRDRAIAISCAQTAMWCFPPRQRPRSPSR